MVFIYEPLFEKKLIGFLISDSITLYCTYNVQVTFNFIGKKYITKGINSLATHVKP